MGARNSRVLHRSLRETPPKAIGGDGVWLIAEGGRRILDASGGAAVSCLGHQHPRVIEAISRQASKLAYAHTSFFSSEPAEALADQLVGDEPGGLAYAYFVSGGSEAIEAGIKLARQYFIETGQPQRQRFIARRQSYHGNTLGALAAGGNAWRREPYAPLLSAAFSHVTPAFAYHEKRDSESEADFVAMLASAEIIDTIRQGSGAFQHGHTYLAHPLACAAALEVQRIIGEEKLLERVRDLGSHLERRLTERFGNHRHVGDIRGRGLFQAIELVADRTSREPFDPDLQPHQRIKTAALDSGLACYPAGGTADGRRGDHVLLAPPYIATSDDIDMIVDRLGSAVDRALKTVGQSRQSRMKRI